MRVRGHHAAKAEAIEVVASARVGMPDVEARVREWLTARRANGAGDPEAFTCIVRCNEHRTIGCTALVERAFDVGSGGNGGARRRHRRKSVVTVVDLRRRRRATGACSSEENAAHSEEGSSIHEETT